MPEYSTPKLTPAETTKLTGMNSGSSGYFEVKDVLDIIRNTYGQNNGVATLGSDGKLPSSQLPDLADDVIVVDSYSTLPAIGTASKIYITADNNKMYRWDPELTTPDYVELSIDLSEYARIVDIQDGNIQAGVAVKAFQDAMGRAIITTYETKADASDLKDAIDGMNARVENLEEKADPTGAYKTVNYRGTNDVPTGKAKYALVESIVGKSRAWNQLLDKSNYGASKTENNVTFTNNGDGSVTVQTTSAGASANTVFRLATTSGDSFQMIANHKYLISGCPSGGSDSTYMLYENYYGHKDTGSGTVFSENSNRGLVVLVRVIAGTVITTPIIFKPIVRDLTPILSDWNSADITTANIPLMVKQIPDLLKYDAYGSSIVNTTVEGVKAVGVNIWNGEKEVGNINGVSGQDTPNNDVYRSVGYIKVEPNTDYYFYNSTAGNTAGALFFYDYNKNYITLANNSRNTKVTTPPNCFYIRMAILIANFGTGVQICLDSASDKTTYHPYQTDTLSLPTSVTLRSAGSVAEVYDLETGEMTEPIRAYTITGNETWGLSGTDTSGQYCVYFNVDGIKPVAVSAVANLLCAEYVPVSANNTYSCVVGISARDGAEGFRIYDPNIQTVDAMKAKMVGKKINYELATPDDPTQLTPVIGNTIQTEGGGTINTIQNNVYPDESPAPTIDNSMDVGYLAL